MSAESRLNTLVVFATPEDKSQLAVLDFDPDEFQRIHDDLGGPGLMLVQDRRGSIIWTIWTTTLISWKATEMSPTPLPR